VLPVWLPRQSVQDLSITAGFAAAERPAGARESGIAARKDTFMPEVKNVALLHGGFVDGGGWEPVYEILKKKGYNVSIVQNPTISLADDVTATKRVLATLAGPAILVGHSDGRAVSTVDDVPPENAAVMADSQYPWGLEALGGTRRPGRVKDQAKLVSGSH